MPLTPFLLSGMLLLQGVSAAQGRIEGHAFRAGTTEPLEGVHVVVGQLGPAASPNTPQPMSVLTRADGSFLIENLAPGSYSARADKAGYATQVYGARGPGITAFLGVRAPDDAGAVATIRVEPGKTAGNILFSMTPTAAVSGRVLRPKGDPAVGVRMELFPVSFDATGHRVSLSLARGSTDDRGDYRLFNVDPGLYYLSASGPLDVQQGLSASYASLKTANATYFPGVPDLAHATVIEVMPGEDLAGLDLNLSPDPQHTYRIRGHFLDATTGKPPSVSGVLSNGVMLLPRNSEILGSLPAVDPHLQTDGSFELLDVPEGAYWLIVRSSPPMTRPLPDPPFTETQKITAAVPVDVTADIGDLVVTLRPPVSVSGRIVVDGQDLSSKAGLDQVRVELATVRVGMLSMNFSTVPRPISPEQDGTLTFKDVYGGDYELVVSDLPKDVYVSEATFGGRDVLGQRFSIGGQPEALHIVLSSKGGALSGIVRDAASKPRSGAQAVLIPESPSRTDLYRAVLTDSTGRFSIRGIPPGNYTVFAWEAVSPFAYFDPEVRRKSSNRRLSVNVSESSTATVDLTLEE